VHEQLLDDAPGCISHVPSAELGNSCTSVSFKDRSDGTPHWIRALLDYSGWRDWRRGKSFFFGGRHGARAGAGRSNGFLLAIGYGRPGAVMVRRGVQRYGVSAAVEQRDTKADVLAFLNTTKSIRFMELLLMTLGPTIALIPLLDRARGRMRIGSRVFGRVQFFYTSCHIRSSTPSRSCDVRDRLGAEPVAASHQSPDDDSPRPKAIPESRTPVLVLGPSPCDAYFPLPLGRRYSKRGRSATWRSGCKYL